MLNPDNEWYLVIALCAAPFILFGAVELAVVLRRRRHKAIAQRSKSSLARHKRGRGRAVG